MDFMAEQLATEHRHLFQDLFIGHLEIFSVSFFSSGETNECIHLMDPMKIHWKLTQITVDVPAEQQWNGSIHWQSEANHSDIVWIGHKQAIAHHVFVWFIDKMVGVSCTSARRTKISGIPSNRPKFEVHFIFHFFHLRSVHSFFAIFFRNRENYGRFLMDGICYSAQMKMLDIICSYLRDQNQNDDGLESETCGFREVFSGCINGRMNSDLVNSAMNIFESTTSPSYRQRHQILDYLNRSTENRSIHSIPFELLKSKADDETISRVS